MRTARAALALLLCFAVPVRAETTSDPLWTMLSTYVLAPDPGAPEGEGDAKGLAGLQADLLLLSDGFEAFRDEEQVKASLEKLHPRMSPELRPFFRDRASSLDAVYRTLAVTDYTWAGRLPTPPCDPGERRAALLGSEDRLFADEKGESSPWLVSLLGPQAKGQQASAALDQASASARLTPAEYERLRAKARRITLALQSPSAEGLARAKLYCGRADIYEKLAAHHRAAKGGLIEASYSGSFAAVPSVLAVVSKERRGAATVVKGPAGTAVLTDAGLVADTEEPTVFYAGKDGQPVELKAKVKRRHAGLGLAELELSETRPALRLAEKAPAVGDLTSSIGHLQIGGLWTRTSGLVARSGGSSFHTDAAVSPEMLGAPVLNEDGEVAGVLSLRKADNEDGEWLVGVPAPLISRWLAGEEIPETAPPAEEVADSGTAAILSHTRLAPIETGLGAWHIPPMGPPPPTVKGVCVSNCGGGYSRSYSSGGSSSYSSGSGGAELGQALGQALAPLVEALIFRGIPALFRGIASLFKKKPGSSSTAHAAEKKVEKRPAAEKQDPPKPPPPPKPAVCSVSIASAPGSIAAKPVDVVAQVSCVGGEAPKAGHRVAFSVQWDRGPIVNAGATDTDTEGLATLELTVENASTKRMEAVGRADESLDELDRVAREHGDEEAPGEGESAPQPAGQLIETQTTVALPDEKLATAATKAATAAAGSRVAFKLKTSGRTLKVIVKLMKVARIARTAGLAAAPASGGTTIGVSLASTLLLFAAEKAVENALASGVGLEPPGDCTDERHSALHKDQGRKCKSQKRTCDDVPFKECETLRLFLRRNILCDEAERRIMDECFRGGDRKHKDLNAGTRALLENCKMRVQDECE